MQRGLPLRDIPCARLAEAPTQGCFHVLLTRNVARRSSLLVPNRGYPSVGDRVQDAPYRANFVTEMLGQRRRRPPARVEQSHLNAITFGRQKSCAAQGTQSVNLNSGQGKAKYLLSLPHPTRTSTAASSLDDLEVIVRRFGLLRFDVFFPDFVRHVPTRRNPVSSVPTRVDPTTVFAAIRTRLASCGSFFPSETAPLATPTRSGESLAADAHGHD